jgi:hypothetical protein
MESLTLSCDRENGIPRGFGAIVGSRRRV